MRAAEHVVDALALLRPDGHRAFLIHRGDHALWSGVTDLLAAKSWATTAVELAADDRRWELPAPAGPSRVRWRGAEHGCDVLLYHDPFTPEPGSRFDTTAVTGLAGAGTAIVFLDFPCGLVDPRLMAAVERGYLAAYSAPVAGLTARADEIAKVLADALSLELIGPDGARLVVDRPWEVRTDLRSAELDTPVLQLPLGETWIACDPSAVNGDVHVHLFGGNTPAVRCGVRAGRVVPGSVLSRHVEAMPVVEIGIGVNSAAAWAPPLTLAEKALRRVHIGFGDSTTIGGSVVSDDHVDVAVAVDTELIATGPRGRTRVAGGSHG